MGVILCLFAGRGAGTSPVCLHELGRRLGQESQTPIHPKCGMSDLETREALLFLSIQRT